MMLKDSLLARGAVLEFSEVIDDFWVKIRDPTVKCRLFAIGQK